MTPESQDLGLTSHPKDKRSTDNGDRKSCYNTSYSCIDTNILRYHFNKQTKINKYEWYNTFHKLTKIYKMLVKIKSRAEINKIFTMLVT